MNGTELKLSLAGRGTYIHFFGLGFIQLKLTDSVRYHFYLPDLPPVTENPHTHRYDFTSTVLYGELREDRYRVELGDDEWVRPVSCGHGAPDHDLAYRGKKTLIASHVRRNESYSIGWREFHTVHPIGVTVTRVVRGHICTPYAWIVGESICPFSRKVDEDTLWELISPFSDLIAIDIEEQGSKISL